MEEFRRLLRDRDDVRIPRVHQELSTSRVLTMEFIEGKHLRDFLKTKPSQEERDALGERLLDLFFRQAFDFGLLHADPHPGNYLFLGGGRIGLLDFGCSKKFDAAFIKEHRNLFKIRIGDAEALERHYRVFGVLGEKDPLRDQKREALLRMQRMDIAKYHEDKLFDFSDAVHYRELMGGFQELVRLGLTTPGYVLYVRAKMGLYHLFHQLGARIRCHKIYLKYV